MARIAHINPCKPLNAGAEMIVRRGPINEPPTRSHPIARGVSPSTMVFRQIRVLYANEVKLPIAGRRRRLLPVLFSKLGLEPASLGRPGHRNQQQSSQSSGGAKGPAPRKNSADSTHGDERSPLCFQPMPAA